jgi:plastocyanin
MVAQQDGGTVTVEMTDGLVFDPDDVRITPGTTVVWENTGSIGHSVTAYEDEIPDEAEYFASGDFRNETAARNGYPQRGDVEGGESYEHTFEVEGDYDYFCIPHEGTGMVGSMLVTNDPPPQPPALPNVPDSIRNIGIAVTATLVVVFAFTLLFLKYGGDYEEV